MKKGLLLILSICLLSILSSCGGALPQTSIPLPSNDPVTVSSPNSSGNVTVSATASSVPSNSIVVVQVGSSSASLNLDDLFQGYFESAQAATCTSTVPACPSLDADGKCQSTANTDGSFSIDVPATTSSTIAVTYLDPDDACTEKTLLSAKAVPSNIISLDREVADMHVTSDGLVYALGADESDDVYVSVLSLDDVAVSFEYDLSTASFDATTLSNVTVATNDNIDDDFLVIEDLSHLSLFPINGTSLDTAVQLFTSGGSSASHLTYIGFNTVSVTTDSFTDFSCETSYLTGTDYNRLFTFSKTDDNLQIVDDFQGAASETLREISLNLGQFTDVSSLDQIYHAEMLANSSNEMMIIASVTNTSDQTEAYVFILDIDTGFCPSDLATPTVGASLGITLSNPEVSLITPTLSSETQEWYAIFEADTQEVSLINITELSSGTDPVVVTLSDYFGEVSDSYAGMGSMTALADDTQDQNINLFFAANDNGNYKVLNYNDGTVTEDSTISATLVNAIAPIQMIYGTNFSSSLGLAPLVVLDTGVTDDAQSNVIFIENALAD